MKKYFNIFNIYVFFLFLYEFISARGASAMLVYLSLGSTMMIALYYVIQAIQSRKTPYLKALLLFVCLIIIYGVIRFIGGEYLRAGTVSNPQSFILNFMHQVPAVVVFYMLAKDGKIRLQDIKLWFFAFLLLSYWEYQHAYQQFLERMAMQFNQTDEMTNNTGYLFVGLFPLVTLFSKKPWAQYGAICIIGFWAINSAKRGAILLFALSFIFFLYVNLKQQRRITSSKKTLVYVFSLLVFVAGIRYFQNHLFASDYFYTRYLSTLEGDTNGRDLIFSSIWNHYINEYNPFQWFFGGGAESTLRYMHQFAHNDWMQILSDCGLIGVIIYLNYWIKYYRTIRNYKRRTNDADIYIMVVTAFIISAGRTLFSMSYIDMPVGLSLAIGYGMANVERIRWNVQAFE
ncbi:MAG: O-antigen ligase family protein [Bacteroidaceae bacterium]|nr:O-antigen ligase family protein [Bacteroidaceae bacterium]